MFELPNKEPNHEVVKCDDLLYYLDPKEKTASLQKCKSTLGEIFIPRSVEYKSDEYIVTSIEPYAFGYVQNVNLVEFAEDSELKIIKKDAFYSSSIECFILPSKYIQFDEGWCNQMLRIKCVKISPKNKYYIFVDQSYLLGKSSPDKNSYDVLLLSVRSIEHALIPSYIEIISNYAFNRCNKLKSITFSEDSNLKTIGACAFSYSSLESFEVPKKLTRICKGAFENNDKLKKFEIHEDSNLKTIEKNTFISCSIESFLITPNLVELNDKWCQFVQYINNIIVQPNERYISYNDQYILGKSSPSDEIYDTLVFAIRNIKTAEIPYYIKKIAPNAFDSCEQLTSVIFAENSELQIIGKQAFANTSIKEISIPPSVQVIGKLAFFQCEILRDINIPENSELRIIGESAFSETQIESLFIPSNAELDCEWCSGTYYINKITIMPDNKKYMFYDDKYIIEKSDPDSEIFDKISFAVRNINVAIIPDFIKVIGRYSFEFCSNLKKVEFSSNSQLKLIDSMAFFSSGIKEISFPQSLEFIADNAFYECLNLKTVEFPPDSQLKYIGIEAFSGTYITNFTIPPLVSFIGVGAFSNCHKLISINASENSCLKELGNDLFFNSGVEEITIPSSVVKIKKKWCNRAIYLYHIEVMPDNERYSTYENVYLIEKSSPEVEFYDVLLSAVHTLRKCKVPDFIRKIATYAFSQCDLLSKIEFENNSQLQVVGNKSFTYSNIEKIDFPQSVTCLGKFTFNFCTNLLSVVIPSNPNLQIIDKGAFAFSSIKCISIPPNIKQISKYAFFECSKLQIVELQGCDDLETIKMTFLKCNKAIMILAQND